MTKAEWTPAQGWAKAALHVPIRMAIGLAAILGAARGLDALLSSVGADSVSVVLPFGAGAIGGALAGVILCVLGLG